MVTVAPSRLTPDEISRVRVEHPIIDVLARAGIAWPGPANRDAMISCPAPGHEDRHPSCIVHPDTGRFHCFGCGAHGDVFTLVAETTGITNLTQAAALLDSRRPLGWVGEAIAARPAVVPARTSCGGPEMDRTPQERIIEINTVAWRYLTSDRHADQARAYLGRRRIDTWRLEATLGAPLSGYTPASRTGLTDHLHQAGYGTDELIDSGWTTRGPAGLADRFHRRVLLPVHDSHGAIVGVIGRDVTDHARAKYLNTPRTAAYRKGNLLYQPAPTSGPSAVVIVCEGPLDALAVAAAIATTGRRSVCSAVSPSGTALTTTQAAQIAALSTRDPIICADADPAGAIAANVWATALRAHGRSSHVVTLPAGHDPASWLAEHGPTGLDTILQPDPGARRTPEPGAVLTFPQRAARDIGIGS